MILIGSRFYFSSEHDLPFGVRILNAFLTLTEYQNLNDALAESAYRQPSSSVSSGTFPDLYATPSLGNRDSSSTQIDESDDKSLSDPSPQVTSDNSGTDSSKALGSTGRECNSKENPAKVVASATPLGTGEDAVIRREIQHNDGDSDVADGRKSKSQLQCKTESSTPLGVEPSFGEHKLSDEHHIDGVTTIETREDKTENEVDDQDGSNRDEEKNSDKNGGSDSLTMEVTDVTGLKIVECQVEEQNESESCVFAGKRDEKDSPCKNKDSVMDEIEVTNSTAAFDSSSCESGLSNDVSLTMEAIDVAGLKIVEYSSSQCQGQQCGEEKDEIQPSISCTGSSCNDSNCTTSESSGNDDVDICSLVLEDLIRKVVEEVEKVNFDLNTESSEGIVGFAACCKACANAQKSCYCSSGRAQPCGSKKNSCKTQGDESLTNRDYRSVEHDLGKEKVDFPQDIQETDPRQSDRSNSKETSCKTSPDTADFVKNDTNPNSENGLRNELIRTTLVSNESLTNGNSRSAEHDLGKETVDVSADIHETDPLKSDRSNGEEDSFSTSTKSADFAENGQPIDTNPYKDNSSRTELIKTPIVCDSFSIRNLNVASEKFLEKSFACVDTCADAEIPECEVNVSTTPSNANGSAGAVDATASLISPESDSEIFVASGHEGNPSSEGIGVPVDLALEEVEEEVEDESWEWFEPPLGDVHMSSLTDMEGEEELLFEEEGGGEDVNQVSTSFNH